MENEPADLLLGIETHHEEHGLKRWQRNGVVPAARLSRIDVA
jgi:hypothetical protein